MPTKITFIIDNPADPTTFEAAYEHVRSALEALPNLQRLESAKVWPKEDGTPTPAYRTIDLYFLGYQEASDAVASPLAGEAIGALIATGATFTGLFSDVE